MSVTLEANKPMTLAEASRGRLERAEELMEEPRQRAILLQYIPAKPWLSGEIARERLMAAVARRVEKESPGATTPSEKQECAPDPREGRYWPGMWNDKE